MRKMIWIATAALTLAGCNESSNPPAPAAPATSAPTATTMPSMGDSTAAPADKPIAFVNTVCPVSGEKIDPAKAIPVTYQGKDIGLCCPDCVEPFNKDPEKYVANLK